jgi:hypothetical protein
MPQLLIEVNRRDLFKGALSLTATASLAPPLVCLEVRFSVACSSED